MTNQVPCIVFPVLFLLTHQMIAEANPKPVEVIGANVAGLHAGLKTNLFSKNGPLDQLNKEIESGANSLLSGLTNGFNELSKNLQNIEETVTLPSQIVGVNIGGLKAGLNTNLFGGSNENNKKTLSGKNLVGVNVLGVKAGIKTNLFAKNGPIAMAEEGLTNLANNANSLLTSVNQGANSLLAELTNGISSTLNGNTSLSLAAQSRSSANILEDISKSLGLNLPSISGTSSIDLKLPEIQIGLPSLTINGVTQGSASISSNSGLQPSVEVVPSMNLQAAVKTPTSETGEILGELKFPNLLEGVTLPSLLVNLQGELNSNLNLPKLAAELETSPSSKTGEILGELKLPNLLEGVTLPNLLVNLQGELNSNLKLPNLAAELEKSPTLETEGILGELKLPNLLEGVTLPNLLVDLQGELNSNQKLPNLVGELEIPNILESITLPNLLINIESEISTAVSSNVNQNVETKTIETSSAVPQPNSLNATLSINLPSLSNEIKETLDLTHQLVEGSGKLKLLNLGEIDKIVEPILPRNVSILLQELPKNLSLPKLVTDLETSIKDIANNKELQETMAIAGVIGVVVLILAIAPELTVALPGLAIAAPEISAVIPELAAVLPEITASVPELSVALPELSLALKSTSTLNIPSLLGDVSQILKLPSLSEIEKSSLDDVLKILNLPKVSIKGIVQLANVTLGSLDSELSKLPLKGTCIQNLIKTFTTLLNGILKVNVECQSPSKPGSSN